MNKVLRTMYRNTNTNHLLGAAAIVSSLSSVLTGPWSQHASRISPQNATNPPRKPNSLAAAAAVGNPCLLVQPAALHPADPDARDASEPITTTRVRHERPAFGGAGGNLLVLLFLLLRVQI
ncbi:hypothetical protein V8C37DRAFT_390386 [Trichoderma ceciliae]